MNVEMAWSKGRKGAYVNEGRIKEIWKVKGGIGILQIRYIAVYKKPMPNLKETFEAIK